MSKKRVAFITGILGQDGSYLSQLLIEKGYEVHGLVYKPEDRAPAYENKISESVILHEGNLKDIGTIREAFRETKPDEVYNLAGITDLGTAKRNPSDTLEINYYGFARIINEAVAVNSSVRILQAGSGQMFLDSNEVKSETTKLRGTEPYSEAKVLAQEDFVKKYREENRVFVCSAYLFNHESPRRDSRFVTTKIIETFRAMAKGENVVLEIGNLESKRDWGYARDYVEAMWIMLQADTPSDYIIATGKLHTVRDFVEEVGKNFNIKISWEGDGLEEVGKNEKGKSIVKINKDFYSEEKNVHRADISKIKSELGWKPKTSFIELVKLMVDGESD